MRLDVADAGPHEPVGQSWSRWTTEMHLLVTEPADLCDARALVDAELDAIEVTASRFRPDSEVCQLAASGGNRRAVSPVLAELLAAALEAARFTDGDVDPTVGAAVVALGYDDALSANPAGSLRVNSVAMPADWRSIQFDGESVQMPAGTLLDLGATAKAFAADRCARRVYRETGAGVLVNLGGDLSTAGPAPEHGWRILVQDNDDDPVSQFIIGTDSGLATSSTRRRRWLRGGVACHHIVNPRTGQSAEPVWRSVSVLAGNCLAANTVSTASVVRGRRAPAWLESLGLPSRLVDRDGVEKTIGGWPA